MKPCPFCKSTKLGLQELDPRLERASDYQWGSLFYILCYDCKAEGPKTDTKTDALKRWDARS